MKKQELIFDNNNKIEIYNNDSKFSVKIIEFFDRNQISIMKFFKSASRMLAVFLIVFMLAEFFLFITNTTTTNNTESINNNDFGTFLSRKILSVTSFSDSAPVVGQSCNTVSGCGLTLVCFNSTCSYCQNDQQCQANNKRNVCKITSNGQNYCTLKNLFPAFDIYDGLATAICFVGGLFSSSGGTGGGGIFVPVLIAVGLYPPTIAIPISKVMIFGAAIANFFYFGRQRHPTANRPLIEYNAAVMMEPFTLAGTVIGVYCNVIFPAYLILICLLLILLLLSVKTLQKAIQTHRKERKEAKEAKLAKEKLKSSNEEKAPLIVDATGSDRINQEQSQQNYSSTLNNGDTAIDDKLDRETRFQGGYSTYPTTVDSMNDELYKDNQNQNQNQIVNQPNLNVPIQSEEEEDKKILSNVQVESPTKKMISPELEALNEKEKKTPWLKIATLFLAWFGIVLASVLKGGGGTGPSIIGVTKCSVWYWVIVTAIFPFTIFMTFLIALWVRHEYRKKVKAGFEFIKGDIRWNTKALFIYPTLCLFAGVAAGALGIGGGMIKGPILLELGVLPQVSAATAAFMILFTSSCTSTQFAILGLLRWDYAAWYAVNGFISSLIGQSIVGYIVKRTNKASLIIFLIFGIIVISSLLLGGQDIYNIIKNIMDHSYMGFNNVCNAIIVG